MGSCMSKNSSSQSQQNAPLEQQRRRLSVNQVAEPASAATVERGQVAASTTSVSVLDLLPSAATARRASSVGVASETQQAGFENKSSRQAGDTQLNSFGVGFVCKKGLKPESPNQDDFCVYHAGTSCLFGVFDGHGPYGHDVSNFVQETLPQQLLKASSLESDPLKAMSDAFPETHRLCLEQQNAGRFDCTLSGTTATLVFVQTRVLHVAHVGDSRGVLALKAASEGADPAGSGLTYEDLTNDHKPTVDAEKQRIVAAGGQVLRLDGDIPHRVFLKGKLYPGLAMTRSIGDTVGSTAGISCEAEVTTLTRQPSWQFLLICSDGVWEFISSQEAVDIVARYPSSKAQEAAEALASEAWGRWIQEEGNVVDDITVVVSWFQDE